MRYNGTESTNVHPRFRETKKQFKAVTITGIIIAISREVSSPPLNFFSDFLFSEIPKASKILRPKE